MRIAYLDCFAGISGDMFLGALLDAGVEPKVFYDAVEALNIGASLQIERVDRSGISSTKVNVLEDGRIAEHRHQPDSFQEQRPPEESTQRHHPLTQHLHKAGHAHEADHDHIGGGSDRVHGRSLSVIRQLIQSAPLADPVKTTAILAFDLLGASEAKIHNVDVEKVHFHEVGAVDAIVDIVAASAGVHALKISKWYCSALNVGGGKINCAHGIFPVPAPATADLLRGVPTYSAHVQQELVTPTGAALVRALAPKFGVQPAMRVENIGYGAGTRNPSNFPNVLRLSVGEAEDATLESVAVLETAIDDLSPQILACVTEQALALGALDVMTTAVQMKKGRMGTLITILADDSKILVLEDLLLRETSTLGVRLHHERRTTLDRKHVTVATSYGEIRIKIGSRGGEVYNAAPEFEDCREAATLHSVAVKQVQQAAIAAYFTAGVQPA